VAGLGGEMQQLWKGAYRLSFERHGKSHYRDRMPVRVRVGLTVSFLCVIALLATAAQASGLTTRESSAKVVVRDRATGDMPDDVSGPQVHFLYVVPADGTDRQLDVNGGMEQSITRIAHWFEGQTGDQALRIDTYKGTPDITFVRLQHSDAQATSINPWPLWVMGEDLVGAGFNNPAKAYAAFYEGHSSWACGGAKSPALPKLGAMYLQAWPTNDARPCADAPGFGTGTDRPGYFEIGLLHEVLHTIGFTPRCAPHASADGYGDHVDDSPTDLMYGPDAKSRAGWDWSHAVLDYHHDDYYRAHIPGCPDLSDSPFLEQIPSFPLIVTVKGKGSVSVLDGAADAKSCTSSCAFSYLRGSTVTLSANPDARYRFVAWSRGCSGRGDCQLTVTGSLSVTATFSPKPKPKCRKGQTSTRRHPCVRR
jgi:Divergent InlB B-repeat domain